ncbi:protein NEDD1 protein [Dioscorea alata]|uniref:Protein NEDD1 protein n=1 Tax=Dioscorea alata TaxID=55571 RepID=A0ACB7VGK9_DIOAL|nr:protein NEDD1 protein [Dioscorea alata]
MSFVNPTGALLAASGGDTVKLFDVTVDLGDPCVLSYSPSPGSHVNSIKWNHTNLVVASAGEDKKITLWHKNGQSLGTIPMPGNDASDDIQESILSVSFSNKGSRYICSGGTSHMIRIWDLQRKRCIKWLTGHSDTITGVMYNCKDEHLASINMKGDLIIHNLASGGRAAEFKDPNGQVLRVLDYSRLSRHILVTAGDDGSIHLWETTGRSPKVSWLKQHSAPTTGVCFSPSSDKIIASAGLDKKLYIFDSSTRRPTFFAPYETPFSSLAYSDDGNILAAGTNSGNVVFYDVRGKPQPFTLLRAYNNSEAVTSLSWQRSKPVVVNEKNLTFEGALLGGISEDSVLMPDPLPSVAASNVPLETTLHTSYSLPTTFGGSSLETPLRNRLFPGGSLSKLQAPRTNYSIKDDMDVFSPLADVQPITPSIGSQFDDHDEARKDSATVNKRSALYAASVRRYVEGNMDPHPISDWTSNLTSRQEDSSNAPSMSATPTASLKSDSSLSLTPPEAWGGNALVDKLAHRRQLAPAVSRILPSLSLAPSGSIYSGIQESSSFSSHPLKNPSSNPSTSSMTLPSIATLKNEALSESSSVYNPSSASTSFAAKTLASSVNIELPGSVPPTLQRRYSTYAERMAVTSSLADVSSSTISSPKSKKTGDETREDLLGSRLARQDLPSMTVMGTLPVINGVSSQPHPGQVDQQQGTSSFSLQLVQRTLEETLGSVQKSIHEDVRNLHIELLRQFHMQEMEMHNLLAPVLEKLEDLSKEVQLLRRENQQLRQLL